LSYIFHMYRIVIHASIPLRIETNVNYYYLDSRHQGHGQCPRLFLFFTQNLLPEDSQAPDRHRTVRFQPEQLLLLLLEPYGHYRTQRFELRSR